MEEKARIIKIQFSTSTGGTGAEVIYALRNNGELATDVLNELSNVGVKTRRIYQRSLPTDSSKDYYFIHRNTGVTEPIIVEYGFIDDTPTNVDFLKDNYQKLAEAVIKGVLEYKDIPYTEVEKELVNTYVVSKGDTLYSISKKFNTSVDNLKELNNLTSNLLTIGTILKVPLTEEIKEETVLYTVEPGDSLYSIAKKNNTSVDKIKELNDLTSNILTIGSVLKIPELSYSTMDYIVKPGDTLYSISKRYNITVDELKKLNNLLTNLLTIGSALKVPIDKEIIYTVKKGDTLYSIANSHNTTVDDLKKLNNLVDNNLKIGQILMLA